MSGRRSLPLSLIALLLFTLVSAAAASVPRVILTEKFTATW